MTGPRIIHQFWSFDPPPPALERMRSFRDFNPSWRHIHWNDESMAAFIRDELGIEAVRCFRAARLPVMRSDLARVATGLVLGGVYADADFTCAGPLDDLLTGDGTLRSKENARSGRPKLGNNFFAVTPGNVFFQRLWETTLENVNAGSYSLDLSRITGPIAFNAVWKRRVSPEEKARFRLLPDEEMARYARPGPLRHKLTGEHWTREIARRRIIDFTAADAPVSVSQGD